MWRETILPAIGIGCMLIGSSLLLGAWFGWLICKGIKGQAMPRLKEAEITINGKCLTQTESGALRVALQFARRDMQAAPNDLLAAGLLEKVDGMLKMIDETEVTI